MIYLLFLINLNTIMADDCTASSILFSYAANSELVQSQMEIFSEIDNVFTIEINICYGDDWCS